MKRPFVSGVAFILIAASVVLFTWMRSNPEPSNSSLEVFPMSTQSRAVDKEEAKEAAKTSQVLRQGAEPMSRGDQLGKVPVARASAAQRDVIKMESVDWLQGTRWRRWSGVYAVEKHLVDVSEKEILAEVSGYILIRNNLPTSRIDADVKQHFVVVDPRLQVPGVVTGFLKVLLREGSSSHFLFQNSHLQIRDSFPDIRTYYVTTSEKPFDPLALKEFLGRRPEVERVELEIVFKKYEKF